MRIARQRTRRLQRDFAKRASVHIEANRIISNIFYLSAVEIQRIFYSIIQYDKYENTTVYNIFYLLLFYSTLPNIIEIFKKSLWVRHFMHHKESLNLSRTYRFIDFKNFLCKVGGHWLNTRNIVKSLKHLL